MVHTPSLAPWIVLCLAVSAGTALADEVYLIDGRIIEGEVTSQANADVVDIKVGNGALSAVQHFERAKVRRIAYGTTAKQVGLADLQTRRSKIGDTSSAAECWALAQDAKTLGDTALYKEAAALVIARDRHHAEARKALGLMLYNGVWLRPNEAAVARGEVYFRGQWIAWIERDAMLADEARRSEELAAARKVREEQRRLAAAAAAASAAVELPAETIFIGSRSASPLLSPYRSLYWPSYTYPSNGGYPSYGGYQPYGYTTAGAYCPTGYAYPGSSFNLSASGGGAHHAWAFNWHL